MKQARKAYALAIGLSLAVGVIVGYGVPGSLVLAVLVATGTAAIVISAALIAGRDPFSVYGLIAGFYLVAFVIGAVYFHFDYSAAAGQGFSFTPAGLKAALAIGLAGFCALTVGYVANPLRRFRSWLPSCPTMTREAPLLTIVLLYGLGWMARAVQVATGDYFHTSTTATASTGATFLVHSVAALPTLATALVGAVAYMGWVERRRRAWKRAFWALIGLEAVWYLPSGERARLVGLALATMILMYYARGRRVPWRSLTVGALLLGLVVFPLVHNYRGQWGDEWAYQKDPGRAFQEGAKALTRHDPVTTIKSSLELTLSRFSDVASVATIVSNGRELSPRRPGETLQWTFEAAVPRAIVPNKYDPGAFGNEFGRAYAILAPFNNTTAIAISEPGELWLSFGWLGVALGMAALGAVFRAFNDYLAARDSDPAALGVYSIAALPLINGLESIVAVGVAGLFKSVFVMLVLLWAAIAVAERLSRRLRPVPAWS
jgi:hypothetical protein